MAHIFTGTSGDDTIAAGDADNVIRGGQGNDDLRGNSGDDVIAAGEGDDKVNGGAGNDSISGGTGNDQLTGGSGDDLIFAGADNDTINGGTGFDTAQYRGSISDYTFAIDSLGRLIITDTTVDRDGVDQVTNVEQFFFNGVTFSLSDLEALAV